MAIPRDIIDRVIDTAKIEEVVGDYVSLRRRGANLLGLCPFHNEKTPSFNVSPSKGIYKCFGCGKAGNAVGFVMEVEQCSFPEAVRMVAKKYHIEVPERQLTAEEIQRQDDRESMFVVNEFSNQFFQDQLWNTDEGRMAGLGYLMQKRGIREDIIRRFQLGYSPEKSELTKALKAKGFNEKYTINDAEHEPHIGTGVVFRTQEGRLLDRFRGRVIFPFFSTSGKVTGFAGRILVSKDNTGKYVNSPTSPLFEKKHELYGFYQAKTHIQRQNLCYLVEGQLDVISLVQAGIENVVSSGGTSLTQQQIKLIHRFTPNITILYDGDKAGIKAAVRGIDMVLREGMSVKIVLLPDGSDPDEFARTHTADELIQYIQQNQVDFIRFKTALLHEEVGQDPQKLANLINEVVASIALIPDFITRQVYIKDTASQLGMQENLIAKRVQDIRRGEATTTQQEEVIVKATPTLSPLEQNFYNLQRLLLRYGERFLYSEADGSEVLVGEYIIRQLQEDEIHIPSPMMQKMVNEYMAHYHDDGFVAERFFQNHPDTELSQAAINMIAEYADSPDISNSLVPVTSRLIHELKFTLVQQRLDELEAQLNAANTAGDWDAAQQIIRQQPMLLEFRNQLSQILGNRVIG